VKDFLEDFRDTLEAAERKLSSVEEGTTEQRPAPRKWSPKELLGHLVDSASNNHQRFVRAQFSGHLDFPGYDQDEWVKVQDYQTADWNALVLFWRLYNEHLMHLIERIPEADLKKERTLHNLNEIARKTVPKNQPVTLEYFIRDYLAHLKHHLQKLFELVGEDTA